MLWHPARNDQRIRFTKDPQIFVSVVIKRGARKPGKIRTYLGLARLISRLGAFSSQVDDESARHVGTFHNLLES
jgi:hypothetical protein